MFTARLLRINARQAAYLRRVVRDCARKDEVIENLRTRLRRIQDDVELLALAVPPARRADALALVRDRHRIENGHIIEEAGSGVE